MARIPTMEKTARLLISILAFPLAAAQIAVSRYELHKYKPPGELVPVNSHNLHAVVSGQGAPTVVLEAGMGGCSLDWCLVQPELSRQATVISYDRAGLGWSNRPMQRPTCRSYVEDLRSMLQKLDRKPPYLLVGHSYGGMIVRLFAAEYPVEVMGLVLVDATPESRYLAEGRSGERNRQRKKNKRQLRLGYLLAPIGMPRMIGKQVGTSRLPASVQKIARVLGYQNNAYQAVYSELLYAEESAAVLQKAQPLRPDLPVVVLSAGKQSAEWRKGQTELLNLSDQTRQIIVEDSWHSIHIHKPDQVIAAVKSLLNEWSRKES